LRVLALAVERADLRRGGVGGDPPAGTGHRDRKAAKQELSHERPEGIMPDPPTVLTGRATRYSGAA
jgi:hypothetical protein